MYLLFLVFIIAQSQAATLYGTVYDFSLEQADNVRITVNTTPEQQLIAVNGRYSVNVPVGDYTITAEQIETGRITASAQENVTVEKEGSYVHDIILFPSLENEESILEQSDALTVEGMEEEQARTNTAIIGLFVGIILVLLIIMYRITTILSRIKQSLPKEEKEQKKGTHKTQEETLPKDLQEMVEFLKSSDNRATQKDIRKKFPQLSEAKISLMVADLEKRGLVEKIKKGRGNIVILKT